jgi:CHAT domain-containing protein/Flp pilus assembly protein TadD
VQPKDINVGFAMSSSVRAFSLPAVLLGLLYSWPWRSCEAQGQAGGPKAPPLTPAQQEKLRQRDRLQAEVDKALSQGKLDDAVELIEKVTALEKAVHGEAHDEVAGSLKGLADVQQLRGDFRAARKALVAALEMTTKLHDPGHWMVKDARWSVANLDQLARLTVEERGELTRALRLNLEGIACYQEGKDDQAEKLIPKALEIFKRNLGEQHVYYGNCLNNLALLYCQRADYGKAERLFSQAMKVCKETLGEEHPSYAGILNNLAEVYRNRGDYTRAEVLCRQATKVLKEALGERRPKYTRCLNNLALLYLERGDNGKAEPLFCRVLEICKEVRRERPADYALALNNLAGLYLGRGDDRAAEPLFQEAVDAYKTTFGVDHPDYARCLNNLAELYRRRRDHARAEPLYTQALEIYRKALGEQHPFYPAVLNNLAHLYRAARTYDKAERLYRRALEITEESQRRLGAHSSERQVLLLAVKNRFFLDSYLALCVEAGLPAARAYGPVVAWKGQAFAQQRQVQFARKLHQEKDSEAARLYAELEEVSRRLAGLALSVPPSGSALSTKELQRRQEELARRSAEVEKLEQQLADHSQAYRAQRHADRDPLAKMTAVLPTDAVLVDLLEYQHSTLAGKGKTRSSLERRLLAFLLRPGRQVDLVQLGPVAPIAAAVDEWRRSLGQAEAGRQAGVRLRELVWVPLATKLEGARLILLSPDGPLGRFPFAALPGKKAGSYLIEEQALAIVPVPRLLPELLAAGPAKDVEPSLLAVGDVAYGAEPGPANQPANSRAAARAGNLPAWKPLPATRGEILAVRDSFEQRYPSARVKLLRGSQATEEAFRQEAPKHRCLHLATHGFFAPALLGSVLRPAVGKASPLDPFGDKGVAGFHPGLLSGLVLAGANRQAEPDQDDGILTAVEVATLDLDKVELAVLSACETGLGESAGGEGLLGLQRAFQVAGARSVVASLWSVDDKATRVLMERFYDNLWAKKLSRLEALREAQLWMLREGRKNVRGLDLEKVERPKGRPADERLPPSFWAAFVLSGDWR